MERVREAFALQANPASSPAQMKEALSWLEKFQNTQEAWQVADQLLAQPAPNGGNGVQPEHIFAAQTMRTKIQYDWAELPAEAHASLRSSLLAREQTELSADKKQLEREEKERRIAEAQMDHTTVSPKLPCLF